jgi:hypothetical protein
VLTAKRRGSASSGNSGTKGMLSLPFGGTSRSRRSHRRTGRKPCDSKSDELADRLRVHTRARKHVIPTLAAFQDQDAGPDRRAAARLCERLWLRLSHQVKRRSERRGPAPTKRRPFHALAFDLSHRNLNARRHRWAVVGHRLRR